MQLTSPRQFLNFLTFQEKLRHKGHIFHHFSTLGGADFYPFEAQFLLKGKEIQKLLRWGQLCSPKLQNTTWNMPFGKLVLAVCGGANAFGPSSFYNLHLLYMIFVAYFKSVA